MKLTSHILVGLLAFLFSTSCMRAENETQISKAEFERLWQTTTEVVGTVERYTKGKGDSLTYEYDGHLNFCSDDIALVSVVGGDQTSPRKLRVSVSRSGSPGLALFRKPGGTLKFLIPLLYMKYDPWGFVPSEDLKRISESEAKEGQRKPGGG